MWGVYSLLWDTVYIIKYNNVVKKLHEWTDNAKTLSENFKIGIIIKKSVKIQ